MVLGYLFQSEEFCTRRISEEGDVCGGEEGFRFFSVLWVFWICNCCYLELLPCQLPKELVVVCNQLQSDDEDDDEDDRACQLQESLLLSAISK